MTSVFNCICEGCDPEKPNEIGACKRQLVIEEDHCKIVDSILCEHWGCDISKVEIGIYGKYGLHVAIDGHTILVNKEAEMVELIGDLVSLDSLKTADVKQIIDWSKKKCIRY